MCTRRHATILRTVRRISMRLLTVLAVLAAELTVYRRRKRRRFRAVILELPSRPLVRKASLFGLEIPKRFLAVIFLM